jgi:hypothetical protein
MALNQFEWEIRAFHEIETQLARHGIVKRNIRGAGGAHLVGNELRVVIKSGRVSS